MDNNLEGKTACVHSCKKIDVPTEEEVCALNELRCIKERVRELKKKISDLSAGLVAGTRDDLMDSGKRNGRPQRRVAVLGRKKTAGCQGKNDYPRP